MGCARSGTTMLRRILNAHSRIACPPETGFMMQLCNLYDIQRSKLGLNHMGFSDEEILARMRSFAESFYRDYLKSQKKARWADKSGYLPVAQTIDKIFNHEALYIGIVRHGLDVSYSICELDWENNLGSIQPFYKGRGERTLAAADYWVARNQMLVDLINSVGKRIHLISYEKLTTEPEVVLSNMFEFIDEPYESEVIMFNKAEHEYGFEDHKINKHVGITNNSGRYHEWSDDIIDRLLDVIRPMLHQFNYEDHIIDKYS